MSKDKATEERGKMAEKDKTETRNAMEANADLAKWCVHIIGPDDVLAMESHAKAVAKAEQINEYTFSAITRRGEKNDVLCFAYPSPWPYSEAEHAASLGEGVPE